MGKDQSYRLNGSGLTPAHIRQNALLRLLAREGLGQLGSAFEIARVQRGLVLHDAGEAVTHVHFPLGGTVVSYVLPMPDGRGIEAATIGREGIVGGLASTAPLPSFARATIRIPGETARLPLARLEEAKHRRPALHDFLCRYADCFIAQTLQSVACSTVHTLEQRYARWLLMIQDRVQDDQLPLTQEALAEMFGVARSWVTHISTALQGRGVISYHRGIVRIEDRHALEETSCDCYHLVRRHFERVAPGLYPGSEP